MNENKERVTVTIDPGLLARIDGVCAARGESRSAAIERMLSNEIGSEEGFAKALENPVGGVVIRALMETPGFMTSFAALVGEHLPEERLEELRTVARDQVERGKERRAMKKANAKRGREATG